VLSDVNGRRLNAAHEKHPPHTSSLATSTTSAVAQRPRGDVVRWDTDVVYAVTSAHGRVYTDGSLGVTVPHEVEGKVRKAARRRRKQQVDATAATGDSNVVDGDGEAHARSGASATDPANGDEERCARDGGVNTSAARKDRSGHSVRKGVAPGGRSSSAPSSAPVTKRASATNRSSTATAGGATAAPARKRKSKPVSPHQPTLAKWLAPKRSSPLVDV
jgi:hypothetical protein